jgi:arylsulfatase
MDGETPVSDDYKPGDNKFTGQIHKVVVEVAPLKLSAAEQEQLRQAHLARKAAE